ncbi:MAG: hypothetical protein M1820_008634 [Bogoriella megaspora]|nr:MAG: hypothetical protein M1820_008634 [Bogoriella megaspora]
MPPQAGQRPQQEQSDGWKMVQKVAQTIGIFMLIQFAMNQFMGGNKQSTKSSVPGANDPIPAFGDRPASANPEGPYSPIPDNIAPMWPQDTLLDISMYISSALVMPSLNAMPKGSLIFAEKNFRLGNWSDSRQISTTIKVPKDVQNNHTLWGHFYVAQSGTPLDPLAPGYNVAAAYHFFRPITQHLARKKVKKTRNLLSATNATELAIEEEPEQKSAVLANYYHPNLTLSLIPNSGVIKYKQVHPAVREQIMLESTGARDNSGQNGWYYPLFFWNTFWQLRDHMMELNSTVTEVPLHIDLNHQSNWKFTILASMDMGMKETARRAAAGETTSGGDGSEMEEVKRILLDSNPILLSTTAVVTVLHTIFEMLAFKNDVSHWRKKKDNVGTSVRTILANVIMQGIIFLYLMDNNENTSWMILFGQGMGIAIEAWKITKAVNVRVRPTPQGSFLPYSITFEDKHVLSESEKKTQEYDQIAFKYLYIVAVPLLLAYAAYSLIYETHKSWYSFIIATLVGSVYAYGFLMMVPSLYINYRLKSVAHMPARAMTYKFLNTFIDDLFAFTIKMPTLHRLATLRDDVIFFVYLYQSYKYKVDYSRVNEFGQGGEDEEIEEKQANKPLSAAADGDAKVQEGLQGLNDLGQVTAKASGTEQEAEARKRK